MERRLKKYLDHGKFENVPEKRSRTMAAIRGKHNRTTELRLKMALIRRGIKGWKLHASELPGKPDFYFKNKRLAVFVDGCYWHGCPRCGHIPENAITVLGSKNKAEQAARPSEKNGSTKKRNIDHSRLGT